LGALAHLLARDRYPPKALWDQPIVSIRLLGCEVWNRIHARRLQDSHGDAVRGQIGRIGIIEMVPPVLRRALDPFPVPVRTLDAIHLAAFEFISLPATTSGWLVPRASLEFPRGTKTNNIGDFSRWKRGWQIDQKPGTPFSVAAH
jgi:hypothetical protein